MTKQFFSMKKFTKIWKFKQNIKHIFLEYFPPFAAALFLNYLIRPDANSQK